MRDGRDGSRQSVKETITDTAEHQHTVQNVDSSSVLTVQSHVCFYTYTANTHTYRVCKCMEVLFAACCNITQWGRGSLTFYKEEKNGRVQKEKRIKIKLNPVFKAITSG